MCVNTDRHSGRHLYLYIGESKELLAILRKILPLLGMDSVADGVA